MVLGHAKKTHPLTFLLVLNKNLHPLDRSNVCITKKIVRKENYHLLLHLF